APRNMGSVDFVLVVEVVVQYICSRLHENHAQEREDIAGPMDGAMQRCDGRASTHSNEGDKKRLRLDGHHESFKHAISSSPATCHPVCRSKEYGSSRSPLDKHYTIRIGT